MANGKTKREENLISLADRPPEERSEIAKAGGIASVEAKRKKKAMKDQLETLLALPSQNKKALAKMKAMGIDGDSADNQMLMMVSMYMLACSGGKGAVQAAQFIRDTVGEKPTDKHSFEVDDGLLDDILQQLEED